MQSITRLRLTHLESRWIKYDVGPGRPCSAPRQVRVKLADLLQPSAGRQRLAAAGDAPGAPARHSLPGYRGPPASEEGVSGGRPSRDLRPGFPSPQAPFPGGCQGRALAARSGTRRLPPTYPLTRRVSSIAFTCRRGTCPSASELPGLRENGERRSDERAAARRRSAGGRRGAELSRSAAAAVSGRDYVSQEPSRRLA